MALARSARTLLAILVAAGVALTFAPSAFALSTTADSTWQTNGRVYAMVRVGNTIYIGGKFTRVVSPDGLSKVAAKNLAALDMTTGAPVPGFSARIDSTAKGATVRSLGASADGSVLYVGGKFDLIGTTPVTNFGAVNTSDGSVNATFAAPAVNGNVHAILVGPSRIYLGGAFSKVGGIARSNLAAVLPSGALDGWAPLANDTVRSFAMAQDGATVFIGGHFTQMNSVARQSVARVDAVSGVLNSWTIPAGVIDYPQTAWAILPYGPRVFIGFGKGPNYVAAFHLDFGSLGSQVWRFNTVGNVESLAMNADGTRLFVGGHFGTGRLQQEVCKTGTSSQWLHGLMSMNPATGQLFCDWIPTVTPYGANFTGVWAMLSTGTQLWVGGFIETISGVSHVGVGRFTL